MLCRIISRPGARKARCSVPKTLTGMHCSVSGIRDSQVEIMRIEIMRIVCTPWESFVSLVVRPAFKKYGLNAIPDPGALNSLPAYIWTYYGLTHESMCLDMAFETLELKLCELNEIMRTDRKLPECCSVTSFMVVTSSGVGGQKASPDERSVCFRCNLAI